MEFRVLRYFLAVCKEGTITRAAKALHVTQPTLSRQLLDLEEELGQQLFIRSYHHITLTPEGRLLRKRAEEIMAMVHKTRSEFDSMTGEAVSGDIYIGGGESVAIRLIAQVIGELRKEYPDIRHHLYSGNATDVMERIDNGMLDFGILIQPANISKYESITLPAKDVWGVVMRKDSPLAKKKTIALQDLLNVPLICSRQISNSTFGKSAYPQWFGKHFDSLNVVATYNLIYNASLLVEEGIGYAIALDNLINVTEHRTLCFRPLKPKLESELSIVWKKSQAFSVAAEIFLERIQQKFVPPDT